MTVRRTVLVTASVLILTGALGTVTPSAAQDGRSSMANLFLSQGFHHGPEIESYGPVMTAESDLPIPVDQQYKVVFELYNFAAESPEVYNDMTDGVARFINMQVEAGVPLENLDIKVVFHGLVTTDVLDNDAYRARFGVDNPNIPLFEALSEAGVDLYVCAQAAQVFDVPLDRIAAPVKVVLSAMTAVVLFQSQGYQVLAY